jgi:Ca2+-binding EF-hand superfamily protein
VIGTVRADPPPPPASVRDAIFFGGGGAPIRIRLHVSIDGKTADAVWNTAMDGLFAQADRDGDGTLDAKERAAFAAPARNPRELPVFDGNPQPDSLRLTFNTKDEKITRAQFGEAMKAAGRGPVTLRSSAARADSRQLSAALFKHLDRDADGRLSPDELKAARESLAFLDVNEDEYISDAELLNRAVGQNNRNVVQFPGGMRQPQNTGDVSDLFFFNPDGPPAVKQLLEARGGRKATALKPTEFGGDAATFKGLDKDGNGSLDTTELTAWMSGPPDLDIPLGYANGGTSITVPPKMPPGVAFSFQLSAPPAPDELEKEGEATAARFKKLAKDGVVEKKAVEGQPLNLALFQLADRNGDDKVDAAEVETALKALAPLANCRVDVVFADQGSGLFELLDRNGDGRLSPRELVESVAVLGPLAGPDKLVGPNDLLRRFEVHTALDTIPVGVSVGQRIRGGLIDGDPPPPGAPLWFTKMDRNGDGDVSLREFLGPLDAFKKLDRNGDGLISAAEAVAK